MTESVQSRSPNVSRRVFYNPRELRAGWRLFIFLTIVITLVTVSNLVVRRLLYGANGAALFLVREMMDFLIFILASWIMGSWGVLKKGLWPTMACHGAECFAPSSGKALCLASQPLLAYSWLCILPVCSIL